ncbi:MAG: hypothetical protein KatS3mg011_2174 [Acidimicrobiia bacterium]|nr:MAG: hypothetical protein KatS3mg011_2174 [Acidimicrobiia bacterium]
MSVWWLVRFFHVGAAILWVGGQLALSLIVRPAAATTLAPEDRTALFVEAGRRFGRVATLALMPVLLASGLALAWHRGVTLGSFTRPGYGSILGTKVVLALVSFGLAALHGLVATRGEATSTRWVGIAGVAVSSLVVLLAVSLVP